MNRQKIVDCRSAKRDVFGPNPQKTQKTGKTNVFTRPRKENHASTADPR